MNFVMIEVWLCLTRRNDIYFLLVPTLEIEYLWGTVGENAPLLDYHISVEFEKKIYKH